MTISKIIICILSAALPFAVFSQTKPPAPQTPQVSAFRHTGVQMDSFVERIRGKVSYSWLKCNEHFRRMAAAAGEQAAETGKDLGKQAKRSVEELSDKAAEFGKETKEKTTRYYREKTDDVADDITEKTKRLEAEIRDKSSDLYQNVTEGADNAAKDAPEKILKK